MTVACAHHDFHDGDSRYCDLVFAPAQPIKRGRVCLDYHIKRCAGPCEGLIGRDDYHHNLEQIRSLCNRAIVLRKGEVVHYGPPASAVDLYLNEIVPKA